MKINISESRWRDDGNDADDNELIQGWNGRSYSIFRCISVSLHCFFAEYANMMRHFVLKFIQLAHSIGDDVGSSNSTGSDGGVQ